MRGSITLEILIALLLFSTTAITVLLLIAGAPLLLMSSREHYEALAFAESVFARTARLPFDAISTHEEVRDIYTLTLDAVLLPDTLVKRLTASVVWESRTGHHTMHLVRYILDVQHPEPYACDVFARGDWSHLTHTSNTLQAGDLLPSYWGFGAQSIDDLAATRSQLALTSATTGSGGTPSFFLFSFIEGLPVYQSSLATSSTTAAVSDVALTATHAYIASASTCTLVGRCGQLKVVDISVPTAPRMVSQLLLPRTTPPYAGDATRAVAAKSLLYKEGYVYLGLEQTPTEAGQEFNIIDVRDPTRPQWVGGFRVGRTVNSILVRENRAYLGTNARGAGDVIVLDVSAPHAIQEVTRTGLPPLQITSRFGYAHTLSMSGNDLHVGRSYISNSDEWMILDAGTSTLPTLGTENIGITLNPKSIRALILREGQAVLLLPHALEIWSLANLHDPQRITSVSLEGEATSAACVGNTIYAGSNEAGVGILNHITTL